MSTANTTLNPTIAAITSHTITFAPAVIAGVQAAEMSSANGTTKQQAVVNAVLAGARAAEGTPNPNVAAIASLVDLVVSVLNATGLFSHKSK
jgi:hypothetical protein